MEIWCALILSNLPLLQETPHHVYLVMEVSGAFFIPHGANDVKNLILKRFETFVQIVNCTNWSAFGQANKCKANDTKQTMAKQTMAKQRCDGKANLIWFWTMANVSNWEHNRIFAPDDHCWANIFPIVFFCALQFGHNKAVDLLLW